LTFADSMEQGPPSEVDGLATSQEIPHFLCRPKVHYRVPILSQLNPVHLLTTLP